MVTQTGRSALDIYQSGDVDWSHEDLVRHVDAVAPVSLLATGTVTLSGGASPAAEATIAGVATDQLIAIRGVVGVDADPAFAGDYGFNYDISRVWDDANSRWNVTITVNWDVDPGAGNDVTATYRIYEE